MFFKFTTLEIILASLVISFITTFLVLPFVNRIGEYFNIKDSPDPRKQKQSPLVRIGGIAIVFGFFTSLFFIWSLNNFSIDSLYQTKFFVLLALSSLALFLLGLFDDIKSLSPFLRLLIQFAVAIFIAESGINIQEINLAWLNIEPIYLPKILSNIFTSFWIVSLINAINWLDGVDGLASGITGFASLGLAIISYQNGQFLVPLIAAGISGCSFGFLRFNFYPAKILMGDSGSYFLGFSLAIVSIMSTSLEVNPIGIFIPCLLLIIPLMDMLLVIIRRLFKRESPFLSDRSHFHHKLIDSGFTELGTAVLFYSLSQWIAVLTIGLASINDGGYLLATMLSSVILFFGFVISKYVL